MHEEDSTSRLKRGLSTFVRRMYGLMSVTFCVGCYSSIDGYASLGPHLGQLSQNMRGKAIYRQRESRVRGEMHSGVR